MQRADVTPALLADVKNYLNITWDDTATDDKVRGLIASASVYLDSKGGGMLDYEKDGMPRTLLMEYARYMRDEALDVFENNYMSMILAMQHERLVKTYVESAEPAGKPDNAVF